jgi:hypothetical protein
MKKREDRDALDMVTIGFTRIDSRVSRQGRNEYKNKIMKLYQDITLVSP